MVNVVPVPAHTVRFGGLLVIDGGVAAAVTTKSLSQLPVTAKPADICTP